MPPTARPMPPGVQMRPQQRPTLGMTGGGFQNPMFQHPVMQGLMGSVNPGMQSVMKSRFSDPRMFGAQMPPQQMGGNMASNPQFQAAMQRAIQSNPGQFQQAMQQPRPQRPMYGQIAGGMGSGMDPRLTSFR